MGKTNFSSGTLSLSLWADLVTWLHVGAPQKILEKLDVHGIAGTVVKYIIHSSQKEFKKIQLKKNLLRG